jgi:hypothetical protein
MSSCDGPVLALRVFFAVSEVLVLVFGIRFSFKTASSIVEMSAHTDCSSILYQLLLAITPKESIRSSEEFDAVKIQGECLRWKEKSVRGLFFCVLFRRLPHQVIFADGARIRPTMVCVMERVTGVPSDVQATESC